MGEKSMTLKFKANILKKFVNNKGLFHLKLDRTYFYPDGAGGQLGDRGTINGKRVLGVIKQGDEILHILAEDVKNKEVLCEIDLERRFDVSQQHTGQHILSTVFQKKFNAHTLSFHMSEEYSTIDLDTIYLTKEIAKEVEMKCFEYIIAAKDVKIYFVDKSKVSSMPFRKIPQNLPAKVRVVEITGVDLSLCGGTHVKNTAEVGLIKILKWEKVKGKNTRVYFLCGNRAIKDYQLKNSILYNTSNMLSIGIKDVFEKVKREHEELMATFKMMRRLKRELVSYIVDELYANAIVKDGDRYILRQFKDAEMMRYVAAELVKKYDVVFFLGTTNGKSSLMLGKGDKAKYDVLSYAMNWKERLALRGGGKRNIITLLFEEKGSFESMLGDIKQNIMEVKDV